MNVLKIPISGASVLSTSCHIFYNYIYSWTQL